MIRRAMRPVLAAAALFALSGFSVSGTPDRFDGKIEGARLVGAMRMRGELFHVQGLAMTDTRIWATSVDRAGKRAFIHEFDRATGRLLHRADLTDGSRYHPGGISVSGGAIWVPVAEMRPDSSSVMIELDAETLRERRRVAFPDHLGCIAVSGERLVAGNWDSRLFYVVDLSGNEPTRAVRNPSPTHYQDIKFVGDQLVAGGSRGLWKGSIDWIDWRTMRITRTRRAGAVGTIRPFGRGGPYTGEGMAIEGRDLYVLPEDGPSRLFRFRLEA